MSNPAPIRTRPHKKTYWQILWDVLRQDGEEKYQQNKQRKEAKEKETREKEKAERRTRRIEKESGGMVRKKGNMEGKEEGRKEAEGKIELQGRREG